MCTYLYNDQDEKDAGSINMVNVNTTQNYLT